MKDNMQNFYIEGPEAGILELVFDVPQKKLNVLSTPVMQELEEILLGLEQRNDIQGLIFRSGKAGSFIAGADIAEIESITQAEQGYQLARRGQQILQRLSRLPFPSLAAIDGVCLGGGLELALFCNYRLASDEPHTRLGLPEVKLGIVPGFGGTQNLPRLCGLPTALDLILAGKLIDARRAYKFGLLQEALPAHRLLERAHQILKASPPPRRAKLPLPIKIMQGTLAGRGYIGKKARAKVMKNTKGQYPAPLKALDLVLNSFQTELDRGLEEEARVLGELVASPTCKSLIHLFYLTEEIKKTCGVKSEVKPAAINRVGMLGAGIMGRGIAWLFINGKIPLRLVDIELRFLSGGLKGIAGIFLARAKRRRVKKKKALEKMQYVSSSTTYEGFKICDLVIEAVVENMKLKKEIFQKLDAICPEQTIFASNTSSLSISELASSVSHPERVVGMHFFNPANRMPLVEIVRGEKTDDQAVATIYNLARQLGKMPIVVADSPGFLVNRVLGIYLNEAGLLLQEGADAELIDQTLYKFGMPMAAFELMDVIGLDVMEKVADELDQVYREYAPKARIISRITDDGRLGQKSGKGFYLQQKGKKGALERTYINRLLSEIRREDGIGQRKDFSAQEIQRRCVLIMVNEAARCLEQGIAGRPQDVDLGMVMGLGFPPFHGGLLKYADGLGVAEVKQQLEELAGKGHARFRPVKLLSELAAGNASFYDLKA